MHILEAWLDLLVELSMAHHATRFQGDRKCRDVHLEAGQMHHKEAGRDAEVCWGGRKRPVQTREGAHQFVEVLDPNAEVH